MEYRELSKEELETVPGVQKPIPASMVGIGAVNDLGEVVAAVTVYSVAYLDPLWVRPDFRRSPFILKRLWKRLREKMNEIGVKEAGVVTIDGVPGPEMEKEVAHAVKFAGGEEYKGVRVFRVPF